MDSERKPKIKKIKEDAIAESLDNTAPVEKILSFLDSKSYTLKVYGYISSLLRQQRRGYTTDIFEHFTLVGNPLNVFSNDWDGGLPSGYFENLSHKCLLPQYISEPRHIGKEDPVTELLLAKQKWHQRTMVLKTKLNVMNAKKKKLHRWMDDNVLYCPKSYVDFAAHLENNPDPLFEADYNWYYAGRGNMHTTCILGSDYIIHSDLDSVYMSQFFKDTMSIDHKNAVTFKCEENLNILETVQQQNYIALRTKHKVIILRITESDGIKLEKVKEIESELPYTSISFDEYHKNILYVTTLDYMLKIVNLDRMTCRTMKLKGKFLSLTDNWNSVIGSEREYFLHVTDNALTFYDKRISEPVQRWKSLKYQTDLIMCNKNLATKYSEGKPQLYLGTTHHLFLLDMRYNSTTKPKAIMRWTHGMRSKITNIDVGNLDYQKDVICLTSHWAPDMCFLSNYNDILTRHKELNSVSMPYRPPDFLDVYNQAQRKGLCCNIYEPVIDRLMMAVTGLSVVQVGDTSKILLQNSLGDISCYSLYPQHMSAYIEDDGVEQLYEWTKKLKWEEKSYKFTHIFDLTKLWNSLKKIPDSYELGYRSHIKRRHNFNEQEIYDTFENGEVDAAFLEAWKEGDEQEEITLNQPEPVYRDIEVTNMELSDDEF